MPTQAQKQLQWWQLVLLVFALQLSVTVSATTGANNNITPQHKNVQQMATAAQPQAAELPQQQQPQHQQQQHQQQLLPQPALSPHTAHVHQHAAASPPPHPLAPIAQYSIHDTKEIGYSPPDLMKDIITSGDDEYNDPYQFLNELRPEPLLPWNPYVPPPSPLSQNINQHASSAFNHPFPQNAYAFESPSALHTPRFLPMFGYPQPVFIPFPMYIAPDLYSYYPSFSGATNSIDADESMSRAAGDRRTPGAAHTSGAYAARNSPIYYVRLPPMPYMFLPSMSYAPAPAPAQHQQPTGAYGAALSSMQPYATVSAFPALSPVFNVPMSFVANGKPGSIYQMSDAPPTNDMHGQMQFGNMNGFGVRAPPPPPPPTPMTLAPAHHGGYRPMPMAGGANNYLSHAPFGVSPAQPTATMQHDSKLTLLKRPYMFNGRPDDIYILPNNFNSIYSNRGFY